MKIRLVAFGIAREILQSKSLEFHLDSGESISALKQRLFQQYPEFSSLKSISFAVGENYQEDSYSLQENDEVVIIPPVSGG